MKLEEPGRIDFISITLIDVSARARQVSNAAVSAIVESAKARGGGINVPLHVRRLKGGRFGLIDGAHRLGAAQELNMIEVPAQVWNCTAQEARFMEADAILATAHITPLDLAVSLAKRKAAYEDLHPETRRGVAGAVSRHEMQRTEMSFADYIATVMGITPRQSRRIIAAGASLDDDQIIALSKAPRRVAMNDIYELAKIGEPEERRRVVHLLGTGEAKSASEARTRVAAEDSPSKVVVADPVEDAFKAMATLWARAPKAAKRRFAEDHADELQALLDSGAGTE